MFQCINNQILELAKKACWQFCYNTEADPNQDSRKHQFSVLTWLRNVIKCALNLIPEPIMHTKTMQCFCYPVECCSREWE